MSVSYRLITANDLDPTLIKAWHSIQSSNRVFEGPFFCPEFTQLAGSVRNDVRVVVIENASQPVGFFPHQQSFLGLGRPVGGPLSDFHGVVATPDSEWELGALMRAANLSVWTFDHLVGNDPKFEAHVTAHAVSPRADLSSGYEQYAKARRAASDQIAQAERKARKFARDGAELSFTLHDSDPDTLDQLIRWKRKQYQRTGLADVFGVSWTLELLRRISQTQTDGFAGVCSSLRVGDRIVAVHMGMRSHRVLHHWFPAYDPDFARFSVGVILLLRMAQALAGSKTSMIDFGRGGLHWKQSFMTGAVEVREGFVELPSLLARTRRLRRAAEAHAARGGMAAALRLPLRAIRRIERTFKFR